MGTGDDFFFTGGGFSDWSGGSAGNFSGGSFSTGGSESNFSYLSGKQAEEALRVEKQHGLPIDAVELPTLLSVWGIMKRVFWLSMLIAFQTLLSYFFVSVPHREMLWTSGILYFLVLIGTVYYVLTFVNWYPIWRKNVTMVRVKRFLFFQQSLVACAMIISLLLLLTPLWCTLADDFLVAHKDWLLKPHLYYEPFDGRESWWVYVVMSFYAMTPISVIIALIRSPWTSEKNVKARWTYLSYCANRMDEAEKQRIMKMANLHEQIVQRTIEIEHLKRQFEELEKSRNYQ